MLNIELSASKNRLKDLLNVGTTQKISHGLSAPIHIVNMDILVHSLFLLKLLDTGNLYL